MYLDTHLSNVAMNYRPAGFISDRILPVVQADIGQDNPSMELKEKTQGMVARLNLSYSEAAEYVLRNSPKLALAYRDFTLAQPPVPSVHDCKRYALKADVTMEDRANAEPLFVQQFEEGRLMRVQDALWLDWEIRVAKLVLNPDSTLTKHTPKEPWSDYTKSDPLGDIQVAIDNVELESGCLPNRILFSGTSWRHFRRNSKVIDKAGNPNVAHGGLYPTVKQVGDLLDMNVMVGNAWYNDAEEVGSVDLRQVWQDHALVYYTPEEPSIEKPSFGYNFRWGDVRVERHPYDSRRHCCELELSYHQDEVITDKELGCLILNTTKTKE